MAPFDKLADQNTESDFRLVHPGGMFGSVLRAPRVKAAGVPGVDQSFQLFSFWEKRWLSWWFP
ncbi:hypothetical protein KSC_090070 [Ktedonobacter sp. SOSP1-52]|nr:hypothetical protein KSC_090070 [Ktedonobacter sp. SOSP1-52]